ncbi:MAG: hypothetical protein WKF83_06855 [Nocardioidaceae bacterium]
MGRKDHARAVAERAGVPVTEQYDAAAAPPCRRTRCSSRQPPAEAARACGSSGTPAALDDALAAARREAAAAFGDDTLLVETYVERGRATSRYRSSATTTAPCVHLCERDCSVQRRHQKVIEEAPAPTISAAVRTQLLDVAGRVAP